MEGLTFRQTGLPKEVKRRILLLLLVFIISVAVFGFLLNYTPTEKANTLTKGELPIIYVKSEDKRISPMHGYKSEMNGCYMRESVVPVDESRTIDIQICEYGKKVKNASYTIKSMDTERKIVEEDIEDLIKNEDGYEASIEMSALLEDNVEYLLTVTLETGGDPVKYYTRIIRTSNEHIKDCYNFAKQFHDTAISGDATSLGAYLETDEELDMDTLSYVTIRSSESQVAWKGFKGEVAGDIVLHYTEIGSDYAGMIFDYQRKDEEENYFNVEEYFKVRYTADKMYLLDYERSMEQIPDRNFSFDENVIKLGVVNDNMDYISNDTGNIAAFVMAGELYEYNENSGELIRVFGFRGDDLCEVHGNYSQHGIKLLGIDENGGLNFVVYGYMNGGIREGYAGVDLYRYDVSKGVAEEQFFIATPRPYPILEAGFSELLYKSGKGDFYIMMDGTLTKVNGSTAETTELLTSLSDEQYATSSTGRYVAYIGDEMASESITVMDLEDESTYEITSDSEDELIRPLAFLEDNLAYGKVRKSDIGFDVAGNDVYPCYNITIKDASDKNGKPLKEYEKEGVFVSSVEANSYTLYLSRVAKNGGTYIQTDSDTIQNSSGARGKSVERVDETSDVYGVVTSIEMASMEGLKENATLTASEAPFSYDEKAQVPMLQSTELHENYYVYVGGRVLLATSNVTDAISRADKDMGIVIDNKQRNIWSRTKPAYKNPFLNMTYASSDADADNVSKCISAILVREEVNLEVHSLIENGETPISVMKDGLKDATTLDLTGCTLGEVLYFVAQDSPVYVSVGEDDARLIVGYDAANIYVYEPGQTENTKMSQDEAGSLFAQNGNIFISYVK